jgi:predicted transcriptional regulator of viral defense system/very-short-patch-repair endonuclease
MARELPDHRLDIVDFQAGVLTRTQALRIGVSPDALRARLRAGHWQRLQRGVYATFTGEPGWEAQLWAALRRAGPDAVLSHYTAAELARITDQRSSAVHVTVPRQQHVTPIRGVVLHRSSRIELARHIGTLPPRTGIEETTLDLTQCSPTLDDALAWLARACGAQLTTAALLRATMDSRVRVRWRRELALALDDIGDGAHSILELRYIRRVERPHRLPRAQRQARAGGGPTRYRDALYTDFGVVVETDGRVAHPLEERWRDHHRDNAAIVDGLVTLRYSWTDVTQRPCLVAAEVAAALRCRGWPGAPHSCGPTCPVRHAT